MTRATFASLALFLTACSSSTISAPSLPSTPTETASPTLPPDAAPTQLQGRWTIPLVAPGDTPILLIINQTAYSIGRAGSSGQGHISVHGDQIEFSRVQSCPDEIGAYRWKISGGILTFIPLGPDPCPRAFVLKNHEFRKLAS
jgi:hypothetical protein